MQNPIYHDEKSYWNINMLLNQGDDFEVEDDEEKHSAARKEKQNTPELEDDIFNEGNSALSAELF